MELKKVWRLSRSLKGKNLEGLPVKILALKKFCLVSHLEILCWLIFLILNVLWGTGPANPLIPAQQNISSEMATPPPIFPLVSPSISQPFCQLFPPIQTLNPISNTETLQLTIENVLLGLSKINSDIREEERTRDFRSFSGEFQDIARELLFRGIGEDEGDIALGQWGNSGEKEVGRLVNEGKEREEEEMEEVNVELELGIGGSRERKRWKTGER